MVTRRNVLGGGLAIVSLACATGAAGPGPASGRRPDAQLIDALLVDESIELSRPMAAFIRLRSMKLPVVAITLEADSQMGLNRLLDKSNAIVGISSGATLFCLERIAWDHGFRLTERSGRRASDDDHAGFRQDVAAFLSSSRSPAASPALLTRAYRPSRVDGTLHVWVMRKSASPQLRPGPREA